MQDDSRHKGKHNVMLGNNDTHITHKYEYNCHTDNTSATATEHSNI